MNAVKFLIAVLMFFLLFNGCKDKTPKSKYGCIKSIWAESPVQAMTFSFKLNSTFYQLMNIDSTKDTINIAGYQNNLIYYLKDTNKVFVDYVILSRKFGGKKAQHYISTGSVLSLSHTQGIKQFYINWPSGQKDLLYVDYIYDNKRDNPCCCAYPLQSLKLNNKSYISKDDYDNYGIYTFER